MSNYSVLETSVVNRWIFSQQNGEEKHFRRERMRDRVFFKLLSLLNGFLSKQSYLTLECYVILKTKRRSYSQENQHLALVVCVDHCRVSFANTTRCDRKGFCRSKRSITSDSIYSFVRKRRNGNGTHSIEDASGQYSHGVFLNWYFLRRYG